MRSPDERVYTAQAQAVATGGLAGTRRVVEGFRRDPRMWLYPPPTRVAYAWLLAAAMKLTGVQNETAGSWVSCLASLFTLLVAIRLGLRFLGRWHTVLGLLFLAVFPPELVIARRCWSDSLVELAALAMMYLACEIWAQSQRLFPYILLPLAGSIAVLIKETTVFVYAGCLLTALWAARRERRRMTVLLGVALAGAAGASALLALATGSLSGAVQLVLDQARHNTTNSYALEYASGPGYLLLFAFWKMSPLTIVLAIWGLAVTIARREQPPVLLAWVAIGNTALYMLIPHWLNLRYASASFAPVCLFAGVGLYIVIAFLKDKYRWAAVAAALVAAVFAILDYQRFQSAWQRPDALDLSVKMVSDVLAE